MIYNKLISDPRLPHLGAAVDVTIMLEKFQDVFKADLEQLNRKLEKCEIERLQHRYGRQGKILYRLSGHDASGTAFDQWFNCQMYARGKGKKTWDRLTADAGELVEVPGWQPVSYLSELEMIVWAFPNDSGMKHMEKAIDYGQIRKNFEEQREKLGIEDAATIHNIRIDRIKYMPAKRCVLRLHADIDLNGKSRPLSLFSKTYNDGRSQDNYTTLEQAYTDLLGKVNIPKPVCFFPDNHTFWQEPWEGEALIDIVDEYDWELLFKKLGELIATFHKCSSPNLPVAEDIDHIYLSAEKDAQKLAWILPEYKSRFDAILAILSANKGHIQQLPTASTPVHGALRIEQLVARGLEFAMVDFDAVGIGDPVHDVTEFIASLDYLEFTANKDPVLLQKAVKSFTESYADNVPWDLNPKKMAWLAVSFYLAKIHASVKHLEKYALDHIEIIFENIDHWLQQLD